MHEHNVVPYKVLYYEHPVVVTEVGTQVQSLPVVPVVPLQVGMVSIVKVVKVPIKVVPYNLEEVVQKLLAIGKIEPVEIRIRVGS